jgi:hypothetical protein
VRNPHPSGKGVPTSLLLATTAVNAALYAAIGALWTAFPLLIFGVRFWPQVFVPAAFSVLFGPWVGGIGAAIGIFLADVIYGHHDALLSFLVGVPSNFIGFFVIGWLTRRSYIGVVKRLLVSISLIIQPVYAIALAYGLYLLFGTASLSTPNSYLGLAGVVVVFAVIGFTMLRNRWADFEVAASIGLAIGTGIIGLGIVAYSTIFGLPTAVGLGTKPLSSIFISVVASSNYFAEIPFMVILTPPVVAACRAAFPGLGGLRKAPSEAAKQA